MGGGQDKPAWTACPPGLKITRVGGKITRNSLPPGKINCYTGTKQRPSAYGPVKLHGSTGYISKKWNWSYISLFVLSCKIQTWAESNHRFSVLTVRLFLILRSHFFLPVIWILHVMGFRGADVLVIGRPSAGIVLVKHSGITTTWYTENVTCIYMLWNQS